MLASGIDVSHHQERIDWEKVRRSGITFAFIKATEDRTFIDKMFARNWTAARDQGILRGAYHFFRPDSDPAEQAKHFLQVLGNDHGELPPALDVEVLGSTKPNEAVRRAAQWMASVESKLRCKPILYTGSAFWRFTAGNSSVLNGHLLWLAHYTIAPQPKVPSAWNKWTFWQFSQEGEVPGINGKVDLNTFNGHAGELEALFTRKPVARKALAKKTGTSG